MNQLELDIVLSIKKARDIKKPERPSFVLNFCDSKTTWYDLPAIVRERLSADNIGAGDWHGAAFDAKFMFLARNARVSEIWSLIKWTDDETIKTDCWLEFLQRIDIAAWEVSL